ncbi:MAG: hypothetical protein ACOY3Y_21525 [Acidobacteriota bacterium]
MRRILQLAAVSLLAASPVAAEETLRTFTFGREAGVLTGVAIEAGVAEVEVVAADVTAVSVEVDIESSKSRSRVQKIVDRLELRAEERGGRLHLQVANAPDHDRDYSEVWTVQIPRTLALELEVGVGDLRILDVAASVSVEAGVGDIRIEGEHGAFGRVRASCGVGDVEIRTPEGRADSDGFIGKSASHRGPGKADLDVEAGVGDITIRLR